MLRSSATIKVSPPQAKVHPAPATSSILTHTPGSSLRDRCEGRYSPKRINTLRDLVAGNMRQFSIVKRGTHRAKSKACRQRSRSEALRFSRTTYAVGPRSTIANYTVPCKQCAALALPQTGRPVKYFLKTWHFPQGVPRGTLSKPRPRHLVICARLK